MQRIKQVFDLYIDSSFHVAFAVASFAGITFIHFESRISFELLIFVGLCTIVGYNLTRFSSLHELMSSRRDLIITFVSVFSLMGALWLALRLPLEAVGIAAVSGFITLLYNGLFSSERGSLREVTGIKIFLIALVWASVTVLIPAVSIKSAGVPEVGLEFIQRFLFVIVLTIPFDIRDVRLDTYQLATIPQILGIKKARKLGLILLIPVLLFEMILRPQFPAQSLVLLTITLLTATLILKTSVQQNRYFASFWIEGIPILWFILLMFFA